MRRQITETINQADDVIHLYPLCDSCLARSEVHGTAPRSTTPGCTEGYGEPAARRIGRSSPAHPAPSDDDRVLCDDQCRRPR